MSRLRIPIPRRRTAAELAIKIAKCGSTAVYSVASAGTSGIRGRIMRATAERRLRTFPRPLRLCLGSGHAPITGWVSVDFEPPADVLIDLRYGLPVGDASVDAIYTEHLVEHMPLKASQKLFREWRRVISPAGVVRIATPNLERLITDYRGDWRSRHEWIHWPEHAHIDTPVHMINVVMREWDVRSALCFGRPRLARRSVR